MTDRLSLSDDAALIRGVGRKKQTQLAEAGIHTVDDLLRYYPVRYRDRRSIRPAAMQPEDRDVLVCGELRKVSIRDLSGGRSVTECVLSDGSCTFSAAFFNMPYLRKSLHAGTRYVLFGKMNLRRGMRVWVNPEMCPEGSERDLRGIIPVYRSTHGITSAGFERIVLSALEAADLEHDWLDEDITSSRQMCSLKFALKNIHFPASEKHYKAARYRIIYELLLIYQLAIRLSRKRLDDESEISPVPDIPTDAFIDSLPFELTDGQKNCIKDIERDLISDRPMNRLVQGDVGCGKTVVAETAIYKCARAGLQSAMMAPTEILARQHYERLSNDFARYGIRTALLVSGMKTAERREILSGIAGGSIDVVIGTHAVIQKDVLFNELALVVTDEQHRFGVNQRKMLARKGRGVNVLVMSATPIPRTMAATVFGDMDFSIIRSRPTGRKKIITRALDRSSRERAYAHALSELETGHLVYIIAPSIDSADDDITSVTELYNEIRSKFTQYRTELLHGRIGKDDKDRIMRDFASGKIQILVATVVIEVGIDVPDATMMIIENSDRFGLAQMHQLRGRVGRSDIQSYCYLINYSRSETARARADAMVRISDGFEISEEDYRLRGPGDLMGTMQSGNYMKDVISFLGYTDILEAAVEDADRIVREPGSTDLGYAIEYIERSAEADNSNII